MTLLNPDASLLQTGSTKTQVRPQKKVTCQKNLEDFDGGANKLFHIYFRCPQIPRAELHKSPKLSCQPTLQPTTALHRPLPHGHVARNSWTGTGSQGPWVEFRLRIQWMGYVEHGIHSCHRFWPECWVGEVDWANPSLPRYTKPRPNCLTYINIQYEIQYATIIYSIYVYNTI